MRRFTTLAAAAALFAIPSTASAANYLLHVGGLCSTYYTDPAPPDPAGRLASVSGWTSINVSIDQRYDHDQAVQGMRGKLDQYCKGGNTCKLMTYSNGGAVVSKTLSVYGNGQWNVTWAMNQSSNEGGSELSSTGWIAEVFGGCDMADEIYPSAHRGGWNHHDTDGRTFYMISGTSSFWWALATSVLLPGEDDGAVAMHSAAGYANTGSWNNGCSGGRWSSHVPVYWCSVSRDHFGMKTKGIECYEKQTQGSSCNSH